MSPRSAYPWYRNIINPSAICKHLMITSTANCIHINIILFKIWAPLSDIS